MAEKNLDKEIADKEAEIAKLKAEQEVLRAKASHLEYPKWIADPNDPEGKLGSNVNTPEEEKARTAAYADTYAKNQKQRDLDKRIAAMKAKAEKEAEAEAEKARAAAARKGKK